MELEQSKKRKRPQQLFKYEPDDQDDEIEFEPKPMPYNLPKNFAISICAPRRSGKSYFWSTLLRNGLIDAFDFVFIICPTLELNDDYQEFADNPRVTLISEPTEEILIKIFDDCSHAQKKVKLFEREKKDIKLKSPLVLVWLDDIIDSGLLKFRGIFDKFAERGRHMNIAFGASSQRISAISRSVRLNSDLFIIFAPYSISEIEQFVEQFISKSLRKEVRLALAELFKIKYEFLLVDNGEKDPRKKLKTSNAHDFINGVTRQLLE